MKGALGDMMKKAQEMQANMQKAQAELANTEVTGEDLPDSCGPRWRSKGVDHSPKYR